MFVQQLLFVAASLSSLITLSLADIGLYEEVPAMPELVEIYPRYGSTLPESLKKSIGYCKFLKKTNAQFTSGPEPKYNGKPSGYVLQKGSAKENDTCLYAGGNITSKFSHGV